MAVIVHKLYYSKLTSCKLYYVSISKSTLVKSQVANIFN